MKKNYYFLLIHILCLYLSYNNLRGFLMGWINFHLPYLGVFINDKIDFFATVILLPVLGFICIKYGTTPINKILGIIYIGLLLLVAIQLMFFSY
jgi:hypothetical protein